MITALSLTFLLSASPQTILLYGADATFGAELVSQLDRQKWSVQVAAPFPAKKMAPAAVSKFTQGKLAYDDLMFEEALPALRAARETYEASALEPEQWAGYQQTLLYLALTLDGMANAEQSDAVLDDLAAQAPDLSIVNESFPPPFRKKVVDRLQRVPSKMGSLRIESKPAGANVFLNGRPRGRTPVVVTDLPGGKHVVSLSLAGHSRVTREVTVIAGFGIGAEATPDLVEAQLAPAVSITAEQAMKVIETHRLPDATLTAALQNAHRDSNKAMGVFIAARADRTTAAVLPAKGPWRGPGAVAGNGLLIPPLRAQLISQIVNWVEATQHVAKAHPVATAEIKKETSSRWWLWTGLGVLVAGGATAAVIAAQSPEQEESTGDAVVGW